MVGELVAVILTSGAAFCSAVAVKLDAITLPYVSLTRAYNVFKRESSSSVNGHGPSVAPVAVAVPYAPSEPMVPFAFAAYQLVLSSESCICACESSESVEEIVTVAVAEVSSALLEPLM